MSDVKTNDPKAMDADASRKEILSRLPAGEVSPFDLVDTHPEDDVIPDPLQAEAQKQLEKGLKDSFPASDPVSALQPITAGPTEEGSEAMAEDGEKSEAADNDASERQGEA